VEGPSSRLGQVVYIVFFAFDESFFGGPPEQCLAMLAKPEVL
jgi:hypothetical protein